MLFNVGAAVKCPDTVVWDTLASFAISFMVTIVFPFFLYAGIYFYCTINGQSIKSLKLRFCMM